jgi:hypothetical protein
MNERTVKTQDARPGEPVSTERARQGGDGKTEASGLSIEKTGIHQSAAPQPGSDDTQGGQAEGWNPYDRRGPIASQATAAPSAPRKPSRIIVTSRRQPGLFERLFKKLGGGTE